MIWVKSFHIFFILAWMAGLFYLPRLFVNHAQTTEEAVRQQLAVMERKLYRFTTPWMLLTLIFGACLLFSYPLTALSTMLWLHLKLLLVIILVVYHFYCGKIIRDFSHQRNQHSHVWFRWFNELPVLVVLAVIVLAVVKPF